MRSSLAVGLLLTSSLSIFGIYSRQQSNAAIPPGPEPVYVNGQMGVYNPDTGVFVPNTSPQFNDTCDLIQARRDAAMGVNVNQPSVSTPGWWYYSSSGFHHTGFYGHSYYSGFNLYRSTHSSSWFGGSSASRSFFSSSSSSHSSSSRGGFGSTGHSFGASHS